MGAALSAGGVPATSAGWRGVVPPGTLVARVRWMLPCAGPLVVDDEAGRAGGGGTAGGVAVERAMDEGLSAVLRGLISPLEGDSGEL